MWTKNGEDLDRGWTAVCVLLEHCNCMGFFYYYCFFFFFPCSLDLFAGNRIDIGTDVGRGTVHTISMSLCLMTAGNDRKPTLSKWHIDTVIIFMALNIVTACINWVDYWESGAVSALPCVLARGGHESRGCLRAMWTQECFPRRSHFD